MFVFVLVFEIPIFLDLEAMQNFRTLGLLLRERYLDQRGWRRKTRTFCLEKFYAYNIYFHFFYPIEPFSTVNRIVGVLEIQRRKKKNETILNRI